MRYHYEGANTIIDIIAPTYLPPGGAVIHFGGQDTEQIGNPPQRSWHALAVSGHHAKQVDHGERFRALSHYGA